MTQKMTSIMAPQVSSFSIPKWPAYAWQTLPDHHMNLIEEIHRHAYVSIEMRWLPNYWAVVEEIIAAAKHHIQPVRLDMMREP